MNTDQDPFAVDRCGRGQPHISHDIDLGSLGTAQCAGLTIDQQLRHQQQIAAGQEWAERRTTPTAGPAEVNADRAPLDDTTLAEIEAHAAAATREPWAIWHDLDHQGHYTVGEASGVVPEGQRFANGRAATVACVDRLEDALFIVNAPRYVRELAAEVRRRQRDKQAGMRREAAILRWAADRLDPHPGVTDSPPAAALRRWADEFAAGAHPDPTTEETR